MKPTESHHAITVQEPDSPDANVIIPMYLDGIMSYIPVCQPTKEEWDSNEFPRIDLTHRDLEWDPYSKSYAEQEEAALALTARIQTISTSPRLPSYRISSMSSMANDSVCLTDDDNFSHALESHVSVSISSMHTETNQTIQTQNEATTGC